MAAASLQTLADVLASATAKADSQLLQTRHEAARALCGSAHSRLQTLRSGGWCLVRMVRDRLFGAEWEFTFGRGGRYRLPASHVPADILLLDGLRNLTDGCRHSVLDLGAGVGQYGHELQADCGLRWRGYDGAGDIEEYTRGFVHFADLTIPLSLPRADWVVSLEVACKPRVKRPPSNSPLNASQPTSAPYPPCFADRMARAAHSFAVPIHTRRLSLCLSHTHTLRQ